VCKAAFGYKCLTPLLHPYRLFQRVVNGSCPYSYSCGICHNYHTQVGKEKEEKRRRRKREGEESPSMTLSHRCSSLLKYLLKLQN
jgi:hypothetical protein